MLGEAYLALNTRTEDDPAERVRAHFREIPRDRLLNAALSLSAPVAEGLTLGDLLWEGLLRPCRPLEPRKMEPGKVLWWVWIGGDDPLRAPARGHGGGHTPALVEAFGESRSAPDWAKDPRCRPTLRQLRNRLKTMPPEEALTKPPLTAGRIRKEITPCTTN
jgi:hypothetical protein